MKKLIFVVVLLTALPALAKDFEMVSGPISGSAAIENGNVKLAREQALQDAMRQALVAGAGAVIDAVSVVEGGTLVQDRIFVHANGYIKDYQIGTDRAEDGVYNISLSAIKVGLGDLTADMAKIHAMLQERGHPRLYALVREQAVEAVNGEMGKGHPAEVMGQINQSLVVHRLESQMTTVGWIFVDPEVASGKVHVENALTTDLAGLNGRDFVTTGADYVILGSVTARPVGQSEMGTPIEVRAIIKIKATDTGETMASVEYSKLRPCVAGYVSCSRVALEEAGDEVAKALSGQVLKTWNSKSNGVGSLHVNVAVADYDVLQALEDQIQKSVANVKSVNEVSFNDGRADLAVMLAGTNSKQLANALNNKSVKGTTIKVTRVTEHGVEVKLVK